LYTHEALRDNYYGDYGWFDPYEMSDFPIDNNGHGTHVTGTMVGNKGIGVFPQGKWMACKGCFSNTCDTSALILCAQFITCPTMPDMTARNCSKAPHVVNNSWGSTVGGLTWFDVVIEAWHEAGIIPVFSAGNAGSPGDRDVISVGATTSNETIAYFSSRGPSIDGKLKPEVSAPGHLILSSYSVNDESYAIASGTSM
jgi:subtilisin family serine protease